MTWRWCWKAVSSTSSGLLYIHPVKQVPPYLQGGNYLRGVSDSNHVHCVSDANEVLPEPSEEIPRTARFDLNVVIL